MSDTAFAFANRDGNRVFRILKRHGKIVFRKDNLFHYSYTIVAVTPHVFHKALLNNESHVEPHPNYYRMNTIKRVRQVMNRTGFIEETMTMTEPDPAYVCMFRLTFIIGIADERLVNRFNILGPIRANILGSLSKPAQKEPFGRKSNHS